MRVLLDEWVVDMVQFYSTCSGRKNGVRYIYQKRVPFLEKMGSGTFTKKGFPFLVNVPDPIFGPHFWTPYLLVVPFQLQASQTTARKSCKRGIGILLLYLAQGGACLVPLLQFVVGIADL